MNTFSLTPNRLEVSRLGGDGPWIFWGGTLPSGSVKYLTFANLLAELPATCQGLVEMSSGSTAMALERLAKERGIPVTAVTDADGASQLRARGYQGEIVVKASIQEGFVACVERQEDSWFWPQQFTNRATVASAKKWAERLAREMAAVGTIHLVVCGLGTGASVLALREAFAASVRVIAVQAAPSQPISGWRHFESQNLGPADLFAEHQGIGIVTAPAEIANGYQALLAVACGQGVASDKVLVVAHDENPTR